MVPTLTSAVALSDATLEQLPDSVHRPTYDRSTLVPGILHIGVGGFHRAHQAVFFDDLAATGVTDWGLVGVGLSGHDVFGDLGCAADFVTAVERHLSVLEHAGPRGAIAACLGARASATAEARR